MDYIIVDRVYAEVSDFVYTHEGRDENTHPKVHTNE